MNVAWVHGCVAKDDIKLNYTISKNMRADIFTKAFPNGNIWKSACKIINISTEEQFVTMQKEDSL